MITGTNSPGMLFAHANPGFLTLDFERASGEIVPTARLVEAGLGVVQSRRLALN